MDVVSLACDVRDRPINLQGEGGYVFFVSFRKLFLDNTRVRIFFFFQNLTLGFMTKTLNQIFEPEVERPYQSGD
jgi:hypothetical protein